MLILVMGLPGTGKTTFAQALAKSLGANHFNSDKIRIELNLQGAYNPKAKEQVYRELLARCEAALEEGQTVIVDSTFYQRKTRDQFIALAKMLSQPWTIFLIQAEEPVLKKRLARKRLYSEADYSVYEKIKTEWEPLSEAHFTLISTEANIEQMVLQAHSYLSHEAARHRTYPET